MNAQLSIGTSSIRQFDGLYSLNDLHTASGGDKNHQPAFFIRNEQTKALISEINRSANSQNALKSKRGGDFQGTFACKELVYAYAMWISPKFMLTVIRAYDNLVAPQSTPLATTAQKQHIKSQVSRRVQHSRKSFQAVWNDTFIACGFNKLENLTPDAYKTACAYFHVEPLAGEWTHEPKALPNTRTLKDDEIAIKLTTAKNIVSAFQMAANMNAHFERLGGFELPRTLVSSPMMSLFSLVQESITNARWLGNQPEFKAIGARVM